jgi:hypothetical protein
MDDDQVRPDTPASPEAAPSQAHGDALMDQSGSRHGMPPETSRFEGDEDAEGDAGGSPG